MLDILVICLIVLAYCFGKNGSKVTASLLGMLYCLVMCVIKLFEGEFLIILAYLVLGFISFIAMGFIENEKTDKKEQPQVAKTVQVQESMQNAGSEAEAIHYPNVTLPIGECNVTGKEGAFEINIVSNGKQYKFMVENDSITEFWKSGMNKRQRYEV